MLNVKLGVTSKTKKETLIRAFIYDFELIFRLKLVNYQAKEFKINYDKVYDLLFMTFR